MKALGWQLCAAGAAGVWAWRRSQLGPGYREVAPSLRLPLWLLGRVATGEPTPDADTVGRLGRLLPRVMRAGLGQRWVVTDAQHRGVPIWVYQNPHRGDGPPTGALLWLHGGGFVSGSPAQDHQLCSRIAHELGILVISVDYRLAPEHGFPAGLDDCSTIVHWMFDQAEPLGIDPALIAVGGASAGGGLAATLAQRCLDEGLDLACQMLVYPMLDDRTRAATRVPGQGEFIWGPRQNAEAWALYLGRWTGQAEPPPYAVAARRADLTGLPPAWLGVGELDLFCDEGVDYADRLRACGVAVTLRVEPAMYHGADYCTWSKSMRGFRTEMIAFLAAGLNRPLY